MVPPMEGADEEASTTESLPSSTLPRKPSWWRTLLYYGRAHLAIGRTHLVELYLFLCNLLRSPAEFEHAFAISSQKFHAGFILMEVVGVASLEIYLYENGYPDEGLLLPFAINTGVRILALCSRRFCKRLPAMQVAMLLCVLDCFLIFSWRPRGIWSSWSLNKTPPSTRGAPPPPPPPPFLNGVIPCDGAAAVSLVSAIYAYQLTVWYNVMFLLTFRWALLAVICNVVTGLCADLIFHDSPPMKKYVMACGLFSMLLALCVKVQLETLQRTQQKILHEKTKEALKEKVLRCQAEFAQERSQARAPPAEGDLESGYLYVQKNSAEGQNCKWHHPAPSLHSAPPVLSFLGPCQVARDGDCLAPDSLVWVQGSVLPCKVQEVKPDQSVLCYDNISGSMKYAQVSGVRSISGEAEWVRVALADGTALTMTVDHPVQQKLVHGCQSRQLQGLKRAGDLQPGKDAVTVLRMVPVPVHQVTPYLPMVRDTSAPSSRIALSVRQPDRHSVFVADGGDGMAAPMAVGSANAAYMPSGSSKVGCLRERWTFLNFEELEERPPRRPLSAPPRLSRDGGPDYNEAPLRSLRRSGSLSDISSDRSSGYSHEHQMIVWTRAVDEALGSRDHHPGSNTVALSQLLSVKQRGLKSQGCELHALGTCKPCIFENKSLHFGLQPCFRGPLCEHCHEQHSLEEIQRKRKSGALRRWEKKFASPSATPNSSRSPLAL